MDKRNLQRTEKVRIAFNAFIKASFVPSRLIVNKGAGSRWRAFVLLGIKTRDGEIFADRGKALFRFSILEAKARALVSLLDPAVHLASACNAGRFSTQLIQLPAISSYNQTIGVDHGNTSKKIKQQSEIRPRLQGGFWGRPGPLRQLGRAGDYQAASRPRVPKARGLQPKILSRRRPSMR